jgi:xylulokinase
VPEATELVALGAAVQAASLLTGADPGEVARAWGTADGEQLEPRPRDDEALARFAAARDAAIAAASAG